VLRWPTSAWFTRPVPVSFWLLLPAIGSMVSFFLAPLAILISYTVFADPVHPSLTGLTGAAFASIADSFLVGVALDTLRLALTVAVLDVVLAYPLAYSLARTTSRFKGLLIGLVVAPLLTNIIVRTLGWIVLLGRHGLVNDIVLRLQLSAEPMPLLGQPIALYVALVHVFLPFVVLPLISSIEAIDRRTEEAAANLGAGPIGAFLTVVLPLSWRGALAGGTLVFLLAGASFITPAILGQGKLLVMSTLIYQQILLTRWALAGALSVALLAVTILLMMVSQRVAVQSPQLRGRTSGGWWMTLSTGLAAHTRWTVSRGALSAWVVLALSFLMLPLLVVVKTAFDRSDVLSSGFDGFTLDWFIKLGAANLLDALQRSLVLAVCATIVSLTFGMCASLALANHSVPGKTALLNLLMGPMTVPAMVLALGALLYFQRLGVGASFGRLLAVHVVLCLPFAVRILLPAVQSIDPAIRESAANLGGSPAAVFWRIVLPLLRPALFSAAIFVFLMSFDETTITFLVAGSGYVTLPVHIFNQLTQVWDPTISAISTVLMAITVAAVVLLDRLVGLSRLRTA
jgi:putative spermidine/putrescine transport system permease protein